MSKVINPAQAGTVESTDILIILSPADAGSGVQVELISPTMKQYGKHIKALITDVIVSHGITDVTVSANDKGALDYTIEARVKTAVMRAIS